MADHSKIDWCDATWNPITGCSVVSPGCTNCYAMRLAGGRLRHHPSRAGLTTPSKAGPVWTGEVRLNDAWLDQPLRWRRPRRIFVCAHGDLFHEAVAEDWIDQVFAVMAYAPEHTFQVLTKRGERMRAYLANENWADGVAGAMSMFYDDPEVQPLICDPLARLSTDRNALALDPHKGPLPNVWLGVSVEDQARADQRIPELLATPAAVRFLSVEPLLGPVDLARAVEAAGGKFWPTPSGGTTPDPGRAPPSPGSGGRSRSLDWVIVGGESGPNARDMDSAWARAIQIQCQAAGVPFFMKQMARKAPIPDLLLQRDFPVVSASDRR